MRSLRNKYPGRCDACECWVLAGDGFIAGKDKDTGHWLIECRICFEGGPRSCWSRKVDQFAERHRREAAERARAQACRDQLDALLAEADRLIAERRAWLESQAFPRCFAVLGLIPPVDVPTIKTRFRNLSLVHHPDKGGDARRFIEIQSAYEQALQMTGGAA